MRFKFIFSGTWRNESGDSFKIEPQNFKSIVRDSNFEKDNLSRIMTTLMMDKNYIDLIKVYAATGVIDLKVEKIQVDDQNMPVSDNNEIEYWSGEYSYIIPGDVNYNKEVDYSGENKDRKDIYKEIKIGMYHKECNERNNGTENDTIINTAILNVVTSRMVAYPLLIEPFTYNEVIEQLAIPPQDTLVKFVEFMNKYKVFYDTPYRFFIDVDAIYLISSSGKATPKQGEESSTMYFTIYPLDDDRAMKSGMELDSANDRYSIPINVKDTNYNIDSSTGKYMGNIIAVMDPAMQNSILGCTALNELLGEIDKKKKEINDEIKSKIEQIKKVPDEIKGYRNGIYICDNNVKSLLSTLESQCNMLKEEINSIPEGEPIEASSSTDEETGVTTETPYQFRMPGTEKQELITSISDSYDAANSQGAQFYQSKSVMGGCCNSTIQTAIATMNIPSAVNAVSSINVFDNKGFASTLHNTSKTLNATNIRQIENNLLPLINGNGNNTKASASQLVSIAESLRYIDEKMAESTPQVETDFNGIADAISATVNSLSQYINTAQGLASSYSAVPNLFGGITKSIQSSVDKISSLTVDIGKTLSEFKPDLSGFGSGITKNTSSVLQNLVSSGGKISPEALKVDSVQSLFSAIRKIKDLSQVAKLGIGSFDIVLNVSGNNGSATNVKINDDNYNMLKNIKASIENKINRLFINKNDLDPSLFSINKEYIVHNYDAHSDKDGHFILSRRLEIYIREDEKFTCNTMLELDKVLEPGSETQMASDAANILNSIKRYSEAITDIASILRGSKEISGESNLTGLARAIENVEELTRKYYESQKNK